MKRLGGSMSVWTPLHQESHKLWWALWRLWVQLTQAVRYIRTGSADRLLVFYTKNYGPAILFRLLKRLSRTNLLIVFEAHVMPSNTPKRYLLSKVDAVVANSLALRDDLIIQGHLPAERVIGVHQGTDLELYNALRISKAEAREKVGLSLHGKLVLYTGKLYWGYKEIGYLRG